MAEEDLSALVTSIDENDIIIIPSNGSENNGGFDFVPDDFSVNPPIVSIQTRSLIREDSEVMKFCEIFLIIIKFDFQRNLKMKHSLNVSMV